MAVASKKKKRRSSSVSVDFTGVEASSRTCEDGTYTATVQTVEETESQEGNPNLSWKWKIKNKKDNGAIIFDNTSLQPQALWRLRLLLEAIGEEIPDGEMDLNLEEYVGREARVEITNEKWEGKNRPRITGFLSLDSGEVKDEEEGEEEEEEEEKPSKKKRPSKKDDEEEEEEKEEEEEEEEEDEKSAKKKRPAKDEDEEDDDAEDEKPSKSKFKVGTKVKFKDEDGKTVRGVIVKLSGKTAQVEDGDDEEWEVETSDLTVAS
jgi:hypothetical protein